MYTPVNPSLTIEKWGVRGLHYTDLFSLCFQLTMEFLLIVVLLFGLSSAYRYGAPIDSCNEMFPVLHGVDARSDDPPFTITVNKNNYTAGSSIEGK